MDNSEQVKKYDEFFTQNYLYLKSFTKSINPKHEYNDTLHDVFLKCRNRIEENGFEGQGFLNYTRVSLMNQYKSTYRNNKKKELVDIDDENFYSTIEEALAQTEDQSQQENELYNRNTYLVSMVYEYLDKYYDDRDKFVFRVYYLLKHKHLNYKQLSEACKMSITTVSNIIKKIKGDLRINLKTFILTGSKMDEKLKIEVADVLTKDVNTYWRTYLEIHQKIFGTKWNGCRCKSGKLKTIIQEWYNKNK